MSKNIASESSKAYTDAQLSLVLRCNQWRVFLRKASASLFFGRQISLSLIEDLDEQYAVNNCYWATGINRVAV